MGNIKAEYPGRIVVDLDAIIFNAKRAMEISHSDLLGIVKANGYGHGLIESSLAFAAAGAKYIGTAQPSEMLKVRRAGIGKNLVKALTWQITKDTDLGELAENDIEFTIGNFDILNRAVMLAKSKGHPIEVQIKTDYQFGRDGFRPDETDEAVMQIADAVAAGYFDVKGCWTHLAMADAWVEAPSKLQIDSFDAFTAALKNAGVDPGITHIANTGYFVTAPETPSKWKYDMTRAGYYCYGWAIYDNSILPAEIGTRPAMIFEADLANIHKVAKGEGVSYGHLYESQVDQFLGVLPIGYADGFPRITKNPQAYSPRTGKLYNIVGRICMDQMFLELGGDPDLVIGDTLQLWGDGKILINDVAIKAGTAHVDPATSIGKAIPYFYKGVDSLAEALGDLPVIRAIRRYE